jgi:DNA polymerase V
MGRGGARKGAGRPKGFGKYNEPTKAVRLPISMIESLHKLNAFKIPLYLSKVAAGFPSPAEDYLAEKLDLNEHLIKHPTATFLVRATGNSMINAGIHENDILVVDRSLTPIHGKVVIAAVDGQLTVKRLHKKDQKYMLIPDNPDYLPIEISDDSEVYIWGVVTNVIHAV